MTDTGAGQSAARPLIEVGGQRLQAQVETALRHAAVDTDTAGPDSCRLLFDDPNRDLLQASGFELAKDLTVSAGRVGDQVGERVFDGIVYAVAFEYDDRGTFASVSAYDRSYGLYNGLHTVTYQNVTDSDLAKQIAGEVGLGTGTIDSTPVLHDHVSQVNETHFDFLSRRAREVGCQLRVTGQELHFVTSRPSQDAPAPGDFGTRDRLQLVPGGNLQRLTVRVSGAQQVKESEVRGWDPATKVAVVATAAAATRSATLPDSPSSLADRFGAPRHVTVDVPLTQQAECDAAAAAEAEHLASACVHAEGVAYGDPRIMAGAAVSLGSTGGRFDGKVTVTRARHLWDAQGYRTTFVASGSHDRSVLGLLDRDGDTRSRHRVGGLVVAVVTNVSDPDKLARVKVKYPWLDADYESDWVRVLQLGAGNDRGLQLLPEVDDEVLVGFEHGDTRRAYVLGGLYNGVDAPPRPAAVDTSAGTVSTRVWRSRSGHEVVLDDTDGAETLTIRAAADVVRIDLDKSRKGLTIHADGDVVIEADGAANITAGKDLTLEAGGDVTISGTKIKLN